MKDKHEGLHSCEEATIKQYDKRCQPVYDDTIVRSNNSFQHGLGFVRLCMDDTQHGVTMNLPEDLRKTGRAQVTISDTSRTNRNVVVVTDVEGYSFELASKDVARKDVDVTFRPLSDYMIGNHKKALDNKKHNASDKRMDLFASILRQNYKTTSDQKVYSLDGNGSNRERYQKSFADLKDSTPQFFTFELDPETALSQQILYGKETVIYTGSLAPFGYGVEGASHTSPPGIEYLITTRTDTSGRVNTLIRNEDCRAVVGLNLDYCGGIFGGLNYEKAQRILLKLLSRLPQLVVLCITIGKRQHQLVEFDFEKYAETPYGFRVVHTFSNAPDDNKAVVSRLFVRDFGIPRTLEVPGVVWLWNQDKSHSGTQRSKKYNCVVQSIDPRNGNLMLYCIDDDSECYIPIFNYPEHTLREWNKESDCVLMHKETTKPRGRPPKDMNEMTGKWYETGTEAEKELRPVSLSMPKPGFQKRKLDEVKVKDNLVTVKNFLKSNGQPEMAVWVMEAKDLV